MKVLLDTKAIRIDFPPEMRDEFMRRLHGALAWQGNVPADQIDQVGRLFLECMEVYENMKLDR